MVVLKDFFSVLKCYSPLSASPLYPYVLCDSLSKILFFFIPLFVSVYESQRLYSGLSLPLCPSFTPPLLVCLYLCLYFCVPILLCISVYPLSPLTLLQYNVMECVKKNFLKQNKIKTERRIFLSCRKHYVDDQIKLIIYKCVLSKIECNNSSARIRK